MTNDVLWFNMGGINDIYILAKYLNNLPKNYKDHSEEFAEILENSIKNSNYKILHVREDDYYKKPKEIIEKCINFIYET